MPIARHTTAILTAVALLAALALSAARADPETPAAAADELHSTWLSLVKYTDLATFSKRMEAIRELGRIDCPEARQHLLTIARSAKSLDDRIVSVAALGRYLDLAATKPLIDLIGRKRDPLLTQALSQAFVQASSEEMLTWLATDALALKEPAVLESVLDAQNIHADPRARDGLHAIFERTQTRSDDATLAYLALRALGTIGDRRDRTFLLRTPSYRDARMRLAGAETIARQKPVDINIRGALVTYLHDESPVVREAAARAIGHAGIVELTDALADTLLDTQVRTQAVAHAALIALHQKDLGWDPEDWKRWWKSRADLPAEIKAEPSSSRTTYYGLQVYSDRVLFIVDLSGSMAFPWGAETAKTRIGVAKAELLRALKSLDEKTLFNVIVFSDDVRPWRKNGEVLATEDAKARVVEWVEKTFEKPKGGTFMHAALETAFEQNPQVDTIFLLTDGLATDGEPIVPEAILASVNRWSRFRRVVVHTFALTLEDLEPEGMHKRNLAEIKTFMRRLATLTGGECRIVTKLPDPR
ncbi:MAG: VWA domain-containing protein [Planctomycetota bacterium]|nr:VWA domain-containing protein [Planctomycetota bacterium]